MDNPDKVHHFAEFADDDVLAKILSDGYIFINDEKIEVSLMDQKNCVKDLFQIFLKSQTSHAAVENSPATLSIGFLTDDCLHGIFMKLHLSTLFTVSKVCIRFNKIAKEVFHVKYKDQLVKLPNIQRKYPISMQLIEEFFTTFGYSIEKLYIRPQDFNFKKNCLNDVLLLIRDKCINLKALSMQFLPIKDVISFQTAPLFSRLERLKINFYSNKSIEMNKSIYNHIFKCTKLTHLNITYDKCYYSKLYLPLEIWLPNLTSSRVFTNQRSKIPMKSNLYELVAENFRNIEDLKMRIATQPDIDFEENLLLVSELKYLRHLSLHFNDIDVEPLMNCVLENNIQLESLTISNGRISLDAFTIISQMKSIQTLKFKESKPLNLSTLVDILDQLPELRKLEISHGDEDLKIMHLIKEIITYGKQLTKVTIVTISTEEMERIDDQDYNEILEIVKERENPKLKFILKADLLLRGNISTYVEYNMNSENLIIALRTSQMQSGAGYIKRALLFFVFFSFIFYFLNKLN